MDTWNEETIIDFNFKKATSLSTLSPQTHYHIKRMKVFGLNKGIYYNLLAFPILLRHREKNFIAEPNVRDISRNSINKELRNFLFAFISSGRFTDSKFIISFGILHLNASCKLSNWRWIKTVIQKYK